MSVVVLRPDRKRRGVPPNGRGAGVIAAGEDVNTGVDDDDEVVAHRFLGSQTVCYCRRRSEAGRAGREG